MSYAGYLWSFFLGVFGSNAIPHFVKGITRERYPTVFGDRPTVNLVAGWAGLTITALVAYAVHDAIVRTPVGSLIATSAGVLLMGLFHARGGAFALGTPLRGEVCGVRSTDAVEPASPQRANASSDSNATAC